MMDQSFDPFGGAGGFGDTSFAGGAMASQAPATNSRTDFDKFPLPCTVATLSQLNPGSEKVTLGKYNFSMVRIIGEIYEIHSSDSGNEISYDLRDLGDDSNETFRVIQYFGVEGVNHATFVEGTVVQAIGKMRSFDNETALVVYNLSELKEDELGLKEVFAKEARIAFLYYTKDVPSMMQSGNMDAFKGTFLSTIAPPSNNRQGQTMGSASGFSAATGAQKVYPQSQRATTGRGNNPQQNKIIEWLESSDQNEAGIHVGTIKSSIGGNNRFEDDIRELCDNGILYCTIDDAHVAVITGM